MQERVIGGDEPATHNERKRKTDRMTVKRKKSHEQEDGKGEHENSLIPTQVARRKLHDLTEEQTAETCGCDEQPSGKEKRPVGVDAIISSGHALS